MPLSQLTGIFRQEAEYTSALRGQGLLGLGSWEEPASAPIDFTGPATHGGHGSGLGKNGERSRSRRNALSNHRS